MPLREEATSPESGAVRSSISLRSGGGCKGCFDLVAGCDSAFSELPLSSVLDVAGPVLSPMHNDQVETKNCSTHRNVGCRVCSNRSTTRIIFNPWRMRERGFVLCACVCVCLSVTTLTATYLVCEASVCCYKVPYSL